MEDERAAERVLFLREHLRADDAQLVGERREFTTIEGRDEHGGFQSSGRRVTAGDRALDVERLAAELDDDG